MHTLGYEKSAWEMPHCFKAGWFKSLEWCLRASLHFRPVLASFFFFFNANLYFETLWAQKENKHSKAMAVLGQTFC